MNFSIVDVKHILSKIASERVSCKLHNKPTFNFAMPHQIKPSKKNNNNKDKLEKFITP